MFWKNDFNFWIFKKKNILIWVVYYKMDYVESKLEIIKLKKSDLSKIIWLFVLFRKFIYVD